MPKPPFKMGFVLDPIAGLNHAKDSSLALILAAQRRGHRCFYWQPHAMRLEGEAVWAGMQVVRVDLQAEPWFELGEVCDVPLNSLDLVFMRKDPPVDLNYIYATYLLERGGVWVVNCPAAMRDCNEKLFATQFPQCCPPLLVSAEPAALRRFHAQHGEVVYKPLDGMGGRSVFRARAAEHNLGVILETLTECGRRPIMAQRYLPEIAAGDKRILVIDGEPVDPCLARLPGAGESRANLAAGGRGRVQPLTERDRWIVEQVAPELRRRGLLFVGLDVIGDYLTEINVTCPTCVREIDRDAGTDIGGLVMDAVERRLAAA